MRWRGSLLTLCVLICAPGCFDSDEVPDREETGTETGETG